MFNLDGTSLDVSNTWRIQQWISTRVSTKVRSTSCSGNHGTPMASNDSVMNTSPSALMMQNLPMTAISVCNPKNNQPVNDWIHWTYTKLLETYLIHWVSMSGTKVQSIRTLQHRRVPNNQPLGALSGWWVTIQIDNDASQWSMSGQRLFISRKNSIAISSAEATVVKAQMIWSCHLFVCIPLYTHLKNMLVLETEASKESSLVSNASYLRSVQCPTSKNDKFGQFLKSFTEHQAPKPHISLSTATCETREILCFNIDRLSPEFGGTTGWDHILYATFGS